MSESLIKLEGVTKVFLTDEVETHALSGIHMDINQGEYVSIAGPSGCGKSTLLSILGLLDTPTDGTYLLNGRPVQGAALRVEGHMSHPGMAPVVAQAAERQPGVYEAAMAFTMRGDWILLVTGTLASGEPIEHRIDVPGVQPPAE